MFGQIQYFLSQRRSQQNSAVGETWVLMKAATLYMKAPPLKKKILILWRFTLIILFLPVKLHVRSSYSIMSYYDRNNS